MTEGDLFEQFVRWTTELPREEVVARCRALYWRDLAQLGHRALDDANQIFESPERDPAVIEPYAQRLEILADGDSRAPMYSGAEDYRAVADRLRHIREWDAEVAEARSKRSSPGRLEALALAGSCWSDDPPDVRLRHIEEVLPRINALVEEARAQGRVAEEFAISEDLAGLFRLRESLKLL